MNHEKEDAALKSSTLGLSMLRARKPAPGKVLPGTSLEAGSGTVGSTEQRGAGCRSNALGVSAHDFLGRWVSNGGAKPDVKQRSANASTERMLARGRLIDSGALAVPLLALKAHKRVAEWHSRVWRARLDPAERWHHPPKALVGIQPLIHP
jgi:hypothetical protein